MVDAGYVKSQAEDVGRVIEELVALCPVEAGSASEATFASGLDQVEQALDHLLSLAADAGLAVTPDGAAGAGVLADERFAALPPSWRRRLAGAAGLRAGVLHAAGGDTDV